MAALASSPALLVLPPLASGRSVGDPTVIAAWIGAEVALIAAVISAHLPLWSGHRQ
ncbi:hypothetical protein [Streptomyces sp. KR55]|uniref:hypothetical protein n=1 Tax=Streptomyces sp. KR55 TaxID=3457425 RepID=UPI003FD18CDB